MSHDKISLCYFNFKKTNGISDYIKYFKSFLKNKIILQKNLTKNYKNTIIIDDFYSYENVLILKNFKKENPRHKLTLICTEFINDKLKTFNNFDQSKNYYYFIIDIMKNYNYIVNKIEKKIISKKVLNIILLFKLVFKFLFFRFRIYKKNYQDYSTLHFEVTSSKKTKISITPKFLIFIYCFSLVFFKNKNKKEVFQKTLRYITNKQLKQRFINAYYFKVRYDNFKKVIKFVDLVFCSHPIITQQISKLSKLKSSQVCDLKFYPTKLIKRDKQKKYLYFSGEYTPFRKNFFNKLISDNNLYEYKSYLKNLDMSNFYTIHEDKDCFLYSLHPSKEFNWIYSSPTRYARSIEKGEIPIVFYNFNDYTSNYTIHIEKNNFDISFLLSNYDEILKDYNLNLKKSIIEGKQYFINLTKIIVNS